jgi:tetratricopeptide (TPR) repeat protein
MSKLSFLILAGLLLLIAGITLLKSRFAREETANEASTVTLAEREKIQNFWQQYREATDHRVNGRPDSAAEAYARALELNDEHEDALYYMGNMLFELSEFADAERVWKRLAEVNPTSARAHSRLGDLYLCYEREDLFDIEAAEEEFQRALEIYQEETGPLLRLGEIALILGDTAKVRYYLDAVTGSNYRSVEAHFLKGYAAWKAGAIADAGALFGTAVQYARPEEPPEGVPGEGDTKAGSAAMVSRQRHCQGTRALVDDLAEVSDSESASAMTPRYRRLDAVLQQARQQLPSFRQPS